MPHLRVQPKLLHRIRCNHFQYVLCDYDWWKYPLHSNSSTKGIYDFKPVLTTNQPTPRWSIVKIVFLLAIGIGFLRSLRFRFLFRWKLTFKVYTYYVLEYPEN